MLLVCISKYPAGPHRNDREEGGNVYRKVIGIRPKTLVQRLTRLVVRRLWRLAPDRRPTAPPDVRAGSCGVSFWQEHDDDEQSLPGRINVPEEDDPSPKCRPFPDSGHYGRPSGYERCGRENSFGVVR